MTPLHRAVIDALEAAACASSDVAWAFVGGSIGAGRSDELSDVDCVLVFTDVASRDAAWSARTEWFARLGSVVVVADASHVAQHMQVGVLDGPVLVDLAYRIEEELAPSPWYDAIRILKDTGGAAQRFAADSAALSHSYPTPLQLTNLSRQFWRWSVFTARDIRRGDVTDILTCLNFLRTYALRRLAATAAGLPWHRFERLERALPPDLVEHLRAGTPRSLDGDGFSAALRDAIEAFFVLRQAAQVRVPHEVDVDEPACRAAVEAMLSS